MEHILPNGLRYYTKGTQTSFSDVSLLIPFGENHEDRTNAECAHTCEHFVCAFNGGFEKPYGFLKLRSRYGIQFAIHTYEDYTLYQILSIPEEGIRDVCRFLTGIFTINKPTQETANREIAIVHSEIQGNEPVNRLYYNYLSWVRHQDGKPTIGNTPDIHSLTPEKVYLFHSQFYRPVHSLVCVRRPEKTGMKWDRELSQEMTRTESFMIPGRNFIQSDCMACKMIEGTWVLPSKTCWGLVGAFFEGEPSRSEVLGQGLIASTTRLTGANESLTDYLRSKLGATYSVTGNMVRIRDSHRAGILVVFAFQLNRHLTRQEIRDCLQIVTKRMGAMPSRGDLSKIVAREVRTNKHADVMFLLKRAGIPILDGIDWQSIHKAHTNYDSSRDRIGSVFSSPI